MGPRGHGSLTASLGTLVLGRVRPLGGAPRDLAIQDGVIVDAGQASDGLYVDCDGLIALPGLVDLHTHLREPGREDAETIATGGAAAARGGYVAVCAMANTTPVADSVSVVERVHAVGVKSGQCHVQPVGAVSQGLAGRELADIAGMAASSATVRVFSDDGNCVYDAALMREALRAAKAVDGVIAQHAQEPTLTVAAQVNEGRASDTLGLPGWPSVAEDVIVARDCILARDTGADSTSVTCRLKDRSRCSVGRSARDARSPLRSRLITFC